MARKKKKVGIGKALIGTLLVASGASWVYHALKKKPPEEPPKIGFSVSNVEVIR